VGIDAADVVGALTQAHYEQDSPKLLYEGTWSPASGADLSAGTYKYSTSADAAVNIAFSGTGFTWYTAKGPYNGKATVVLDNGTPVEVDLYAATTAYQQGVWSASGLAAGPHTVRIQPTGTKNAASTNYFVGVDGMDVTAGTITPAHFEQNNPKLMYEGAWSNSTGADHSAGSYKFSSSTSAAVYVGFKGTSFDWYTVKGPLYGIASVSVDNGAPVLVDLYNASMA